MVVGVWCLIVWLGFAFAWVYGFLGFGFAACLDVWVFVMWIGWCLWWVVCYCCLLGGLLLAWLIMLVVGFLFRLFM